MHYKPGRHHTSHYHTLNTAITFSLIPNSRNFHHVEGSARWGLSGLLLEMIGRPPLLNATLMLQYAPLQV
jgi:hypothetical protein